MSTNRLYDSLLSLPLFLGMTRYDFQNVAGKTRFDFQKLEAGETIVEEGTSCTRLYYLISGDITVITQADDYGYQVPFCSFQAFRRRCRGLPLRQESRFPFRRRG